MIALLLVHLALAGGAFYHPEEVARFSTVFNAAAEQLGPAFEKNQAELSVVGKGLEELELGVALLGDQCPPEVRTWADGTRRTLTGQYVQIQRHVDLVQDDYAKVFSDALARALGKVPGGKTATECQSKSASLGPMMGASTSCQGTDLNPALAKALDVDPMLQAAVTDINGVPWPTIGTPPAPQPVVAVTGTERWVNLAAVAQALVPELLAAEKDALEADLESMDAAIETGEAGALDKAKARKAAYLAKLGTIGSTLRGLVATALPADEKKGGQKSVGYCVNPQALGGCPGTDVTATVIGELRANAKLTKALDKAF